MRINCFTFAMSIFIDQFRINNYVTTRILSTLRSTSDYSITVTFKSIRSTNLNCKIQSLLITIKIYYTKLNWDMICSIFKMILFCFYCNKIMRLVCITFYVHNVICINVRLGISQSDELLSFSLVKTA